MLLDNSDLRLRAPRRLSPGAGPVGVAPAHLLTLPLLDAGVPGIVEVVEGGDDLAPFALALAAEGILTHADLDRVRHPHLLPICAEAFDRWVKRETLRMRFKVAALFTDDWLAHLDLSKVDDGSPQVEALKKKAGALSLGLRSDCADYALIGPKVIALELRHPGLGASVLRILEHAFNVTIGAFGPARAYGAVQCLHWMGEGDHQMVLEEMDTQEFNPIECFPIPGHTGDVLIRVEWSYDEKETFIEHLAWEIPVEAAEVWIKSLDFGANDLLTTDRFFERLPEWCCNLGFRPMPVKKLRRIARRLPAPMAAIVTLAADLAGIPRPRRDDHRHFYAVEESPYPILLGWRNEGDMVARMYDDMMEGASQSGEATSVRCCWMYDPASVREIRSALRDLRRVFAVLRGIHHLLLAVSTRIFR